MTDTEPDGEEPLIFVITGKVRRESEGASLPFNALLSAADDDSAVRACLEALAQEGYEEADLDQIGNVLSRPEDGEFADAYEVAEEGSIGLIVYEDGQGSFFS